MGFKKRNTPLVGYARRRLREMAQPALAPEMAAYMKTEMAFYGVQATPRRRLLREVKGRFAIETQSEYETAVLGLWSGVHREDKYMAIAIAQSYRRFIAPVSVPLYEQLVRQGAWWDLVDPVATHLVGGAALKERGVMETMDSWIADDDMWIRRTAILSQNRHKHATDAERLFSYCTRCMHEKEFFIRKAIGWALREYSKSNPERVAAFLQTNKDRLSGLSFREGSRLLGVRASSGDD